MRGHDGKLGGRPSPLAPTPSPSPSQFAAALTPPPPPAALPLQVMLQQNFQANERRRVKVPEKEMRQKAILYRLASWPNLTRPPPPPSPRPGWRRSPA